MTIETLSTYSLLQELTARGFFTESQSISAFRKLRRTEAKAAAQLELQNLADQIVAAVQDSSASVFSVKKTSNSVGIMDLVEAERDQVLKALSLVTAAGVLRKVGLVGGVEKPASEVNAFQIRYVSTAEVLEAPAEEEEAAAAK